MQRSILVIVLSLAAVYLTLPSGIAQADELVLWNKLGSDIEALNSEIGPGGDLTGGSFMPGVFGGAYVATEAEDYLLTFPADITPAARGTIEYWAKLTDFPIAMSGSGIRLSGITQPPVLPPGVTGIGPDMGLGSNDGCGGGGLFSGVNAATDFVCTGIVSASSGSFGSWTYGMVLDGVEDWHHYAMVWDEDGVPGFEPWRLVLFLDGELESGRHQDRAGDTFEQVLPGNNLGLLKNFESGSSAAIDNIKIWDFAKTDFSDRFDEDAGAGGGDGVGPAYQVLVRSSFDTEFIDCLRFDDLGNLDSDVLGETLTWEAEGLGTSANHWQSTSWSGAALGIAFNGTFMMPVDDVFQKIRGDAVNEDGDTFVFRGRLDETCDIGFEGQGWYRRQ